jgi:cyclophilin family peptidyl-prolyl cis-trans isomerase
MTRRVALLFGIGCLLLSASCAEERQVVLLETSAGSVRIELFDGKSPATVENFLGYVRSGFYDGTVFHRVIPGFVIQGGGLTAAMQPRPTGAPVRNESANGLKNLRGTLAMARTSAPDSATSQFFINLRDNEALDPRGAAAGYTVFGKVIEGMEVVDRIAAVPTGIVAGFPNAPLTPALITSVKIVRR